MSQPKKDNKEDQASQLALDRAAKAKESRDRFLQTMSGSITLKDAAEGDPEAVVHPKPKMVQKGAKPPVVLSDDLKQSYLSERENKLKDHADEVAQHLKQREVCGRCSFAEGGFPWSWAVSPHPTPPHPTPHCTPPHLTSPHPTSPPLPSPHPT